MSAISEAELDAALIREFCSGRKLMEAKQQEREIQARQQARTMGKKTVEGLGKHVASIPAHEFFIIGQKYGNECWDDKGFVRDFQRLHPELSNCKV